MAVPKQCKVCYAESGQLRKHPSSCSDAHHADQRACAECWEGYISVQVEEKLAEQIECMFCDSLLPEEDLKDLSRLDTGKRYDARLQDRTKYRCQNRCKNSRILDVNGNPTQDPETGSFQFVLQDHNRAQDGRIFACKYCGFQTCVECDCPEHNGQTCAEYQVQHEEQPIQVEGKVEGKVCKSCPSCKSYFIIIKGCGYTTCSACQYRFCQRCLIPWVGEGSAYLGGNQQHGIGLDGKVCAYRDRAKPSGHALKNRFDMSRKEEGAEPESIMIEKAPTTKQTKSVSDEGKEDVAARAKRKRKGGAEGSPKAKKTKRSLPTIASSD